MKRVLSLSKKSNPSKLLQKVFSKNSTPLDNSMTETEDSDNDSPENEEISYQQLISTMQEEIKMKDKTLISLTKEKERMMSELKKYKRSNLNLRQQLEDERAFYLKEKEHYCKEMSETEKSRQKQTENSKNNMKVNEENKEIDNLKTELTKFKLVLNQTLEANYNLSVKFLRMKNTKYSLKSKLKREETENSKIISDLANQLEDIKEELDTIVSDKFRLPIPPSNKKYLHVMKQNTRLLHNNLNLQIQVSRLYNDIERLKANQIKNETNWKLPYAKNLDLSRKESCDKMCEVNFSQECRSCKSGLSMVFKDGHSDDSSISFENDNEKETDIFSGVHFSAFPQNFNVIRTQSDPDLIMQNDSNLKDSGFDIPKT